MALTDIFIKRPVLSVVVSLLILLIGLRAASVLPIRQYPKLSNTVINVTTVYPGASAEPDPGLHHHADRAGGRLGRRRRLHHLVVGAGHQHDPGLHQAELRSEPGADRSARQGELGQIPDPEGIQRPDRDQDDRPDHGRDVSRLLQRRTLGFGDLGLSDARGAAGAVDGRRRGVGRHSRRPNVCDAVVARSGADGRPRRVAERRSAAIAANNFQAAAGQAKGYFIVSNVRPIPTCATSTSSRR